MAASPGGRLSDNLRALPTRRTEDPLHPPGDFFHALAGRDRRHSVARRQADRAWKIFRLATFETEVIFFAGHRALLL